MFVGICSTKHAVANLTKQHSYELEHVHAYTIAELLMALLTSIQTLLIYTCVTVTLCVCACLYI